MSCLFRNNMTDIVRNHLKTNKRKKTPLKKLHKLHPSVVEILGFSKIKLTVIYTHHDKGETEAGFIYLYLLLFKPYVGLLSHCERKVSIF